MAHTVWAGESLATQQPAQEAQVSRGNRALTSWCAAGKSGLVAAVAHALSQDAMCRTHVVWIRCGEIETETLGKAKAHLLPLVSTSAQGSFSPCVCLFFHPCCEFETRTVLQPILQHPLLSVLQWCHEPVSDCIRHLFTCFL